MIHSLDYLREFNEVSIITRMLLSVLVGGIIGLERQKKRRPAGFRTYMLVCLGAAMTMLLGQYYCTILQFEGLSDIQKQGVQIDVSRFSAQVVSGIGFLGAGTILVTPYQSVKGLTTAAGLWTSACMGLAIGAGFYECAFCAVLLILFVTGLLSYIEKYIVLHLRNMDIYVEFESVDNLKEIVAKIKEQNAIIHEVNMIKSEHDNRKISRAVFSIQLKKGYSHTHFLTELSELEAIYLLEEIK